MKKILVLFLLILTGLLCCAQDSTDMVCYTVEEIQNVIAHTDSIEEHLRLVQEENGILTKKIIGLNGQIADYKLLDKEKDSEISIMTRRIETCEFISLKWKEYGTVVKPKWYESRGLMFLYGFGGALGAAKVVDLTSGN